MGWVMANASAVNLYPEADPCPKQMIIARKIEDRKCTLYTMSPLWFSTGGASVTVRLDHGHRHISHICSDCQLCEGKPSYFFEGHRGGAHVQSVVLLPGRHPFKDPTKTAITIATMGVIATTPSVHSPYQVA